MRIKAQSDKQIKEDARQRVREMLIRMSFAARWEPLWNELCWVIKGRENEAEHVKILPDYCYHIFALFKRTLFKVFPTRSEIIKIADKPLVAIPDAVGVVEPEITINWESVGAFIGVGQRSFRFFHIEVEDDLRREGLLNFSQSQYEDLAELFIGNDWLKAKLAGLQALNPGKTVEEIVSEKIASIIETIATSSQKAAQFAYGAGPDAMTQLNQGLAKGTGGFMDSKGELIGQNKFQVFETYAFLLTVWPEIQEMIAANPPKTRSDLWDWLTPFSNAGWIEIKDLDQLNRLCDSIKLKLKAPGPPHKAK